MPVRRTNEATTLIPQSFRYGISLASIVLIASVFGAPSASAGLPGKAAGAAGSVVPPVTGTPAPPSLPNAVPPHASAPAAPKAPVEVPTLPPAPAKPSPAPQTPPVKAPKTTPISPHPVPAPSGGSTKPSGHGVDLPPVGEMAGTRESAGPATSPTAGGRQTVASARAGAGRDSSSHRATPPGIEAGSLESAKVAPLRRLLAYVWPAIPLGPAWRLLATLQAGWEATASFAISDVPWLLSGLTGVAGAGGVAGISEHSATSNPSPGDSTGGGPWVLDGGEISLLAFLVSCAALIALLLFTVRRELRAMYRRSL